MLARILSWWMEPGAPLRVTSQRKDHDEVRRLNQTFLFFCCLLASIVRGRCWGFLFAEMSTSPLHLRQDSQAGWVWWETWQDLFEQIKRAQNRFAFGRHHTHTHTLTHIFTNMHTVTTWLVHRLSWCDFICIHTQVKSLCLQFCLV